MPQPVGRSGKCVPARLPLRRLFRKRPVHGLGEPRDRRAEALAVRVGQPVQLARQQRAGALAVLLGQALERRDDVVRQPRRGLGRTFRNRGLISGGTP